MKKFKKKRKQAIAILIIMLILFSGSLILTFLINEKLAGVPIGFLCCAGLLKAMEKVLEG